MILLFRDFYASLLQEFREEFEFAREKYLLYVELRT